MNKLMIVARQVIRKNLKSPAYIISLLFPVILIAIIGLIVFINQQTQKTPQIAIISENQTFRKALIESPTHGDYHVKRQLTTRSAAEKQLANEKLDGYLTVTVTDKKVSATYRQRTNGSSLESATLKNNLNTLKIRQTAVRLGLTGQQLQELFTPSTYHTQNVAYQNGHVRRQRSNQQGTNTAVAFVVTLLIYMFINLYASMIAQETATEKGSHIMEILVSSVSPDIQFFGKITGMLALIVLQVVVTGLASLVGIQVLHQNVGMLKQFSFNQIQPGMITVLIAYFLVGIMLYTVIAAMLGAMVTRQEEVGQVLSPLTTVGMIAYIVSFIAVNSNSLLIRIGSFIPFLSQSLMPVRYAVGNASLVEVWISIGIAFIALIGLTWVALREYRRHVLDYNTRRRWFNFRRSRRT